MHTFYFNDKTEKIQKEKPDNIHVIIRTEKYFEEFVECFDNCRLEGNSIIDSIEYAR